MPAESPVGYPLIPLSITRRGGPCKIETPAQLFDPVASFDHANHSPIVIAERILRASWISSSVIGVYLRLYCKSSTMSRRITLQAAFATALALVSEACSVQ